MAGFPRCVVVMEACLSAHFACRALRGMALGPRIIPASDAKPFRKWRKDDDNEAKAIAEAAPHLSPDYSFGGCLAGAVTRMPENKAAIVLAKKRARIAWNILRYGISFDAPHDRDMATEAI